MAAASESLEFTPMKAIRLPRLADMALEPGHLLAAGPAPRRPLVDHHRMAAQLRQPLLERVGATGQELIGLVVELGERLGRARQRLRVVGRLAFVRSPPEPLPQRRQRQHDERKCRRHGHGVPGVQTGVILPVKTRFRRITFSTMV